jgi:polar amino acid transport system substrate-binding protein
VIRAAAALAFVFATPAVASGLDRVRARGEFVWAGDLQGGEPYVYRDPRDPSRLIGFEVEIADGLAKRLGVRERFVQNDWANLLPSLVRGDFDAALNGIEDTPAVRAQALVTRPYFRFAEQLVTRRGSRLRTLADLRGHRVGTLASSLAHAMLRAERGVDVVLYGGQEEPYRDLQLGRTDAVLLDSVIASRYALTKPDLELANADVARGTYVIAVRKADGDLRDALDRGLLEMESSGELTAIFRRYALPELPANASGLNAERLPPGAPLGTAATAPRAPPAAPATVGSEAAPGDERAAAQARFDSGQIVLFLRGAAVTVAVSFVAMALAVPLGLALALARLYGGRLSRAASHAYVELFRGTPVLLQLYLLYYGIAPLVHLSALEAAILGLGLNYGAYEAEVHRAAIGAIPAGQAEAAAALGLSRAQQLRLVLLPQALRTALPAMTNDLISLLKDSSLVSVITVVELTKQMTITAVDVRSWAVPGLLCAALYFAMSYPLARVAARLEARLSEAGEPVVQAAPA